MEISVNTDCKLLLHADDSAVLFPHKDPEVIANKLGCVLDSCNKWLIDNNLFHCIWGRPSVSSLVLDVNLRKFLALLSNAPGKLYLPRSLLNILGSNSRLKFLYRQTRNLNYNCRRLLCSALIQCLFDYASYSWFSGISVKHKNKLQTTQNKMVRFIT